MEIGFIGLGLMGRPMAMHLGNAGHRLHLWARRPASLEAFRNTGAVMHASPAELGSAASVVFTVVADGPDVEQVLLGEQGVALGMRAGGIIVDMTTIAPAVARDLAARLAAKGMDFVDAPVSGGESGAINASLTIMAGGSAGVFERVRPLLELLGKSVTRIGASGAGQVAKACNQILTGVGVAAVAEAINFARASGVDAAAVRAAMMGGFAYSRILENHGQRMLDRNFQPGFKAWMHHKDLAIVVAEAVRLGLESPLAEAAADEFGRMKAAGLGEEDSIAVLKILETKRGSEH